MSLDTQIAAARTAYLENAGYEEEQSLTKAKLFATACRQLLALPLTRSAHGGGADYHYRNETQFFRAIERARFFQRNNMVVGQGVRRLAANLVQDGFNLDVTTSDEKADKDLKDAWYAWCEDPELCDAEGEKTFYEMEVLAAATIPTDGDLFCLPLSEGSLQWMEAHRCRKPRSLKRDCVHGVTLDKNTARRKSYLFTREDVDPLGSVRTLQDVVELPARDADGEKQ